MGRTKSRGRKKLAASTAPAKPREWRVPKRWVKFVVALFLVPPCWILTRTFFGVLASAAPKLEFWAAEPVWFFGLGVVLWLIIFFGLPRPVWFYVFGHEWTHALAVWMSGGEVSSIHISVKGGHVMSDRINTWIALAPYFVPVYSVLVVLLWNAAGMFWDLGAARPVYYLLLGVTWAFHLTFTCSMLRKGQPDVHYGGTLYSLLLIYFVNLALLLGLLTVASPKISVRQLGAELYEAVDEIHDAGLWLARVVP